MEWKVSRFTSVDEENNGDKMFVYHQRRRGVGGKDGAEEGAAMVKVVGGVGVGVGVGFGVGGGLR